MKWEKIIGKKSKFGNKIKVLKKNYVSVTSNKEQIMDYFLIY